MFTAYKSRNIGPILQDIFIHFDLNAGHKKWLQISLKSWN